MDALKPFRAAWSCRLRSAWLLLALLAGPSAYSGAQVAPAPGELPEYDVKAAFLLNFARFVTWPASAFAGAHTPFTICVLGSDPFDGVLDQVVAGENLNGRRVAVVHLTSAPQPKACQMLFIGRGDRDPRAVLESIGPGVLTVGEQPGFLRDGGIIQFVVENRHVRFDISQRAASRAALTLSARLLAVARSVEKQ